MATERKKSRLDIKTLTIHTVTSSEIIHQLVLIYHTRDLFLGDLVDIPKLKVKKLLKGFSEKILNSNS